MHAFAISVRTTVLVEKIVDDRWINPLVMELVTRPDGSIVRCYNLLFSEAVDPFNTPAIRDTSIFCEYDIPNNMRDEFKVVLADLKQRRTEELLKQSGLIIQRGQA
jgi:hypothetical protein